MRGAHTSGPWTVDGPPWNQIVWSDAENRVCFLAHTNGLDDDRDIATGHLIAAAPELLDALKSLVYAYGANSAEPEMAFKAITAQIDKAAAAIAKAEGRPSPSPRLPLVREGGER
jgi:hypothetical protein